MIHVDIKLTSLLDVFYSVHDKMKIPHIEEIKVVVVNSPKSNHTKFLLAVFVSTLKENKSVNTNRILPTLIFLTTFLKVNDMLM